MYSPKTWINPQKQIKPLFLIKLFNSRFYFLVQHDIVQHGWTPVTTTTSVLGVVFDSGVAVAADTLTSYGSMAYYLNNPRILQVQIIKKFYFYLKLVLD